MRRHAAVLRTTCTSQLHPNQKMGFATASAGSTAYLHHHGFKHSSTNKAQHWCHQQSASIAKPEASAACCTCKHYTPPTKLATHLSLLRRLGRVSCLAAALSDVSRLEVPGSAGTANIGEGSTSPSSAESRRMMRRIQSMVQCCVDFCYSLPVCCSAFECAPLQPAAGDGAKTADAGATRLGAGLHADCQCLATMKAIIHTMLHLNEHGGHGLGKPDRTTSHQHGWRALGLRSTKRLIQQYPTVSGTGPRPGLGVRKLQESGWCSWHDSTNNSCAKITCLGSLRQLDYFQAPD